MQYKPSARAGRALIVAILAIAAFAPAAKADTIGGVPALASNNSVGSIRATYYLLLNSHSKATFGNAYGGGVTLTIDHNGNSSRTSIAADYVTASKGGNSVKIIPVLIEYQMYSGVHGGMHPYITYGAGPVFTNITDLSNNQLSVGKTRTALGYEIGYGVDFQSRLYVEARYMIAGTIAGDSLNGPQIHLGIRF